MGGWGEHYVSDDILPAVLSLRESRKEGGQMNFQRLMTNGLSNKLGSSVGWVRIFHRKGVSLHYTTDVFNVIVEKLGN